MQKEKILSLLRKNQKTIRQFGVKRIGIFGSVARNEAGEESDIDMVVEFEKGRATFRNVARLIDFLEDLFGKEIDLLTPDGIESIRIKHIKEQIKKEIEYV